MENSGMNEASYWGMVWKTNARKKEITALHEFILELIADDKLDLEMKYKYQVICDLPEKLEHEKLKKKLAKINKSSK